jgi:hypothetical protein
MTPSIHEIEAEIKAFADRVNEQNERIDAVCERLALLEIKWLALKEENKKALSKEPTP